MKRLSILLLLLIFSVPAFGQLKMLPAALQDSDPRTVDLAWDDNTETDLAGYKVYQSATAGGPYTMIQDTGPQLRPSYTTAPLQNGTYCFVVTAYNTSGLESGYSNEVCTTLNNPPSPPSNLREVLRTTGETLRKLGEYLIAESDK